MALLQLSQTCETTFSNAIWSATRTANQSLINAAQSNDTLSTVLDSAKTSLSNEITYHNSTMTNYGQYQIGWRQELASASPGNSGLARDVNWARQVTTARDSYFSGLGSSLNSYVGSVFGAATSYNDAMFAPNESRFWSYFGAAHEYDTAMRNANNTSALSGLAAYNALSLANAKSMAKETVGQAKAAVNGDSYKSTRSEENREAFQAYLGDLSAARAAYAFAAQSAQLTYVTSVTTADVAYKAATYRSTSFAAYNDYSNDYCRLTGQLNDALKIISSGGTVEATYFDNGTSSVDVQVCFVAGTPVLMVDGSTKPIEAVKVGDWVLSKNHENPDGELLKRQVLKTFSNGPKSTWRLRFGCLAAEQRSASFETETLEIRVTGEHPFWVLGRGWTLAERLQIGDTCVSADGTLQVVAGKKFIVEKEPVYNFEVDEAHTYFVGKNTNTCVWVHNTCPVCGNGSSETIFFSPGYMFITNIGNWFATSNYSYRKNHCECPIEIVNAAWTASEQEVLGMSVISENRMKLAKVLLMSRKDYVWGGSIPPLNRFENCHRWVMGMRDTLMSLDDTYWNNEEYEIQYVDWKVDPSTGFVDHGLLIIRFKNADGSFDDNRFAYLDNGLALVVEVSLQVFLNGDILSCHFQICHWPTKELILFYFTSAYYLVQIGVMITDYGTKND